MKVVLALVLPHVFCGRGRLGRSNPLQQTQWGIH